MINIIITQKRKQPHPLGCVHLHDVLQISEDENQERDSREFYDEILDDKSAAGIAVNGPGNYLRHADAQRVGDDGERYEQDDNAPVEHQIQQARRRRLLGFLVMVMFYIQVLL